MLCIWCLVLQKSGASKGDPKDADAAGGSGSGGRQHYGPVGVVGKKKGQRAGAAKAGAGAPAPTTGLGGSASNVVPALSVINIKDLPANVRPLLRDPRQTSRTGGNSKRHVYAYRGVCRQSRKGHDRWQSQISFMGTNHYLGTFDSEWDAAAIYGKCGTNNFCLYFVVLCDT